MKIKSLIGIFVISITLFIVGFSMAGIISERANDNSVEICESSSKDVKLPGEVQRRKITVEEVKAKLDEMAELTVYSGEYTVDYETKKSRYLSSIEIPGTTNSIAIEATGIVKVGYDVSMIKVKVGDDKIFISIPDAKLNDNYVIWDSVECTETNCILNPLEFSQYHEMIDEIEKMGLKQVETEGIYDKADRQLKKLIGEFLSEFDDYEVVYI